MTRALLPSLLMGLALPATLTAAGRVAAPPKRVPVGVARSLGAHLDNLRALAELPWQGLPPAVNTVPRLALGRLGPDALQEAYLAPSRSPQQAARAAHDIIRVAAGRPGFAAELRPALEGSHEGGADLAARLERWSADAPLQPATDDAWNRLGLLFEAAETQEQERMRRSLASREEPLDARAPQLSAAPIRVKPHVPTPTLEEGAAWFSASAPQSAGWVFQGMDREILDHRLEAIQAPEVLRELARAASRGETSADRLLTERYPALAYQFYHDRRQHVDGGLRESFTSLADLITVYRGRGVEGRALRVLLDHSWDDYGRTTIEHGPATWAVLDAVQRAAALRNLNPQEQVEIRGGRSATLVVSAAAVPALARKYAMGRDPRPIERFLRAKLKDRDSMELPLESVLPRYIRRHLNRFQACSGANCYAAALSALGPYEGSGRYEEDDRMMARLESPLYAEVSGAEPEPGDVLVYRNPGSTEYGHASVYLGDGLVFTKNGVGRYTPYLLQTRAENEFLYFPRGEMRMRAFRPAARPARPRR